MGTWLSDDSAKALADAYKNADMHAGNEMWRDVPGGGQRVKNEHSMPETVDWEAHRRFMRGM